MHMCWSSCCLVTVVWLLGPIRLFATLCTIACQNPLSVGFSRQKYWIGLLILPGDLPNPGINHAFPALAGGFFTIWGTRAVPHAAYWAVIKFFVPDLGVHVLWHNTQKSNMLASQIDNSDMTIRIENLRERGILKIKCCEDNRMCIQVSDEVEIHLKYYSCYKDNSDRGVSYLTIANSHWALHYLPGTMLT